MKRTRLINPSGSLANVYLMMTRAMKHRNSAISGENIIPINGADLESHSIT